MAGSNIWILWFWMVTNKWQFYRLLVSMDGGIDAHNQRQRDIEI